MKLTIEAMEAQKEDLNENIESVTTILKDTVTKYCNNLDKIMEDIYINIVSVEDPSLSEIEKYFIKLSTEVYFVSGNIEILGLYSSISKTRAMEAYNDNYLNYLSDYDGKNGTKKATVAETTAYAEQETIEETALRDVYNKAYKIVANKISAAETVISTLSKLMTHRMQESQLNTNQTERQILNESEVFK